MSTAGSPDIVDETLLAQAVYQFTVLGHGLGKAR